MHNADLILVSAVQSNFLQGNIQYNNISTQKGLHFDTILELCVTAASLRESIHYEKSFLLSRTAFADGGTVYDNMLTVYN